MASLWSGSGSSWRVTPLGRRPPAERALVTKPQRPRQQRGRGIARLRRRRRISIGIGQRQRAPVLAQAVFAQGGQLDENVQTVEGCDADALSKAGEHLFATLGLAADGRALFLQDELQGLAFSP